MKKRLFMGLIMSCLLFSSCSSGMVPYDGGSEQGTVSSLTLSQTSLSMRVNEKQNILAYVTGTTQDAIEWKVTGMTSVISIRTVTVGGVPGVEVTANQVGDASVVAILGEKFATCAVNVSQSGGGGGETLPTGVSVSPSSKTIEYEAGASTNTFSLSATVEPVNAKDKTVTWSTNSSIVTLSATTGDTISATVTGTGLATITAKTVNNKTATCSITSNPKGSEDELTVSLDKSSATVTVGENVTLTADSNKQGTTYQWASNNEGVATVNSSGIVTTLTDGQATITVTGTNGSEVDTASCLITVNPAGDDEYEQSIARWSKPGHLYIHYLRDDGDYDKWAIWTWAQSPIHRSGSLWAANQQSTLVPYRMSTHWMYASDISDNGADTEYVDKYGRIADINLLLGDEIIDGYTGKSVPLITNWDVKKLALAAIGFLIVDQTKMTGDSHWTSDGGREAYIEYLNKLFPEGQDSYLHIFCKSGTLPHFTTSSGQKIDENPTQKPGTNGKYRSVNDIENLLADKYPNSVSTSETFLEDRPGTGYQIFVPSFADGDGDGMGDLRGIIEKLQYLKDLGIEVLWLTPIQKSVSYHGYDVTDYYKIDAKFGSMEDYQELIYKAHKMGMKVLMDMVINHTSKSNVLFDKSQRAEEGTDPKGNKIEYRNMYLWKYKDDYVRAWDGVTNTADGKADPATYADVKVSSADAHDWYQDGESDYYYYGKFGSGMAELNYSCQATRDYMTEMCKYWLSFGLDGFRLDAIKHIYLLSELSPEDATKYSASKWAADEQNMTQSGEIVYDAGYKTAWDNQMGDYVTTQNDYSYHRGLNVVFWKEFAGSLKSAYPNCFLVGENFDGYNARISAFYDAMDSQFDFSTYYHLKGSTDGGIIAMGGDLVNTYKWYNQYRGQLINGAFTSNHDVARFINHAGALGSDHHTEINSDNAPTAFNRARWFGAITILAPGVSWIYYGDELGMTGNLNNGETGDHGNNVDRWYRQPMPWGKTQGQDMVVDYQFESLHVEWDNYNKANLGTVAQQWADQNSLLNLFANLCKAKNDDRYPTYGSITNQWREAENNNCLCLHISDGTRVVNAFINATGSNIPIASNNQGAYIWGSEGANGSTTYVPANGFVVLVSHN